MGLSLPHLGFTFYFCMLSAHFLVNTSLRLDFLDFQVASYFRIALQIGWDYTSVLKYQNRAVDFINLVSGRARMSLANLVFKTFNIPSKQVSLSLNKKLSLVVFNGPNNAIRHRPLIIIYHIVTSYASIIRERDEGL